MRLQRIDAHGLTIGGRRHDGNHDQFAIAELRKSMQVHQTSLPDEQQGNVQSDVQGRVFLVADGVSGGPASERASRVAVGGVVDYFLNEMPWFHLASGEPQAVMDALADALRNAQAEIESERRKNELGMGTTLTLAFVAWPHLYVAHVGDSRCYLQRGKNLQRLTTDHTLAAVHENAGAEAKERDAHVLWNSIGGHSRELHPEVHHVDLQTDDVVVLCTDGVIEEHTDASLRKAIEAGGSAEELCGALVTGKGQDDQTAVVVRFVAEQGQPARKQDAPPRRAAAARPIPRVASWREPQEWRRFAEALAMS